MSRTLLRAAFAAALLIPLAGLQRSVAAQDLGYDQGEVDVPTPAPAPQTPGAPQPVAAPEPVAAPQANSKAAGPAMPKRPPLPLFYNYYVGPPGVPAQIYPMPRPTPAYVGQVWITYPPFMPHEYLYHHHRRYYRYTPGGYSSASVRYSSGIMGFIPAF